MLDVMHCEKNICENLPKTICGEKDNVAIRKDMQEISIHPQVWFQQAINGNYIKLGAPYVMTDQKKKLFL